MTRTTSFLTHFDFVYVTSYNECDVSLIKGLSHSLGGLGKSFAVVGYVSDYVEQLHRNAGVEFYNLRMPGPLPELSDEEAQKLEAELGETLASFTFPEARYYMTSPKKLARRTKAVLAGWNALLKQVSIGAMIHKLGAEIVRRVSFHCADGRGIKTIMLGTFPACFPGRTYLHQHFWSERDSALAPCENVEDEVSFSAFRDMLDAVRERRQVIHYQAPGGRRLHEIFAMSGSLLFNRQTEFLGDIFRRRLELLRFKLRLTLTRLFAQRTLPRDPFYFFPLHVFDDSQITVRNPEFYDQSWLIESLERALPSGMKLVVKTHPGLDGAVPSSFLMKLASLRNVYLLDSTFNAHDIIVKSSGVIIINSTVGLESIIHGKPVLAIGRWSFGGIGLTLDLDDFRKLSNALLRLKSIKPNNEKNDKILYNLYGEMSKFSYNRSPISYNDMAVELIAFSERI